LGFHQGVGPNSFFFFEEVVDLVLVRVTLLAWRGRSFSFWEGEFAVVGWNVFFGGLRGGSTWGKVAVLWVEVLQGSFSFSSRRGERGR